ncbi:MAG: CHC2 zinc finger domain-containing protein [Anaerovoracaceae bacterium]
MDKPRQIQDALKLKDVMEFYGVHFNARGFAKCPFHSEKTASLSIKREHYKCFGCGVYGGVIDFVMEFCGISFTQALVKLDSDFNLGLIGRRPTYRERLQIAENKRIERICRQAKADRNAEYLTLCEVHSILFGRLCNGEDWLGEIVEKLDYLLDDFSGEEARLWETIMK